MEVVTKGRCEYYVSVGGGVDGKNENNKNPWLWRMMEIIYLGVGWDGSLSVNVATEVMRPKLTVVLVVAVAEGNEDVMPLLAEGYEM